MGLLGVGPGLESLQHPPRRQQAVTTAHELALRRRHGVGCSRITANHVNPGHGIVVGNRGRR